jgi:hypothetical protein
MRAYPLLPYAGRRMYRFPVKVTFGETAARLQVNIYPRSVVHVIAPTAADAAHLIKMEIGHIPCVELQVFGPQGGVTNRYWGFETAIFMEMCRDDDRRSAGKQLPLPFIVAHN